MEDFVVAGIPAGVLVVAMVQAIKRIWKVEGDAAIPLALAAGIIVALGCQAARVWPELAPWWQTAITGLLLGLAACGLYDAGQAINRRWQ